MPRCCRCGGSTPAAACAPCTGTIPASFTATPSESDCCLLESYSIRRITVSRPNGDFCYWQVCGLAKFDNRYCRDDTLECEEAGDVAGELHIGGRPDGLPGMRYSFWLNIRHNGGGPDGLQLNLQRAVYWLDVDDTDCMATRVLPRVSYPDVCYVLPYVPGPFGTGPGSPDYGCGVGGDITCICTTPETVTLLPSASSISDCPSDDGNLCFPRIGSGPYGILKFNGTIGGVGINLCLTWDVDENGNGRWSGSGTISLSCGDKDITVSIYCDFEEESDTTRTWLIKLRNETDAAEEVFPLDIDTADPLLATVSETLTVFCGSDVVVADVQPFGDPPSMPFCPDIDPASLCHLDDGIPPLEINEDFALGDYGDVHVEGSLPWDEVEEQWGPADITWTANCPGAQPDGGELWEDATIEGDGSGGFTLKVGGFTVGATTASCALPLHVAFANITPPLLCDPGVDPPPDPSITLPFDMPS